MTENAIADIGQSGVTRNETCSLSLVRRVAAMLDLDPDGWKEGDFLPRGWHFIVMGADTRRSALRGDGFPGLGVPLPDLGLPRLMLGGRTVCFNGDIPIGATLRRDSRVQKLSRKDGANGPMAVVTLAHDLYLPATTAPVLMETQTYLLLGAQPSGQKLSGRRAAETAPAAQPVDTKRVLPDDTLLFQYSALGFNSHRIHLDRDFACNIEGFPDLVVNGGLSTLLLTEFLRMEQGVTPASFAAKHVAPLFCGRPMSLGAEKGADKWSLRAFDDVGRLAVDIEAVEARRPG